MNSTLSVSRQTLQILQFEFERGHKIVDSLWKQYNKNPKADLDWKTLFEPSDFFITYPVSSSAHSLNQMLQFFSHVSFSYHRLQI